MSYEHVDFDRVIRFDSRMLGSIDNQPHTNIGRPQNGTIGRPQLSVVPDHSNFHDAGSPTDDELWQERALCAQTDPEAFFPEKGGSTREAKRICLGCEVKDECLDYALAHDERFGIWGGLSERERRRLKRGII